ncbi:MAG: radical SAM protein [Cloacibacillus sp.]
MRIPDNDSVSRDVLIIDVTDRCNYSCPWCGGISDIKNTWDNAQVDLFKQHIKRFRYGTYSFHGGEPLVDMNLVEQLTAIIREQQPKAIIRLFTNGTLLTDGVVAFIKRYDIYTVISAQATGYKNAVQLLEFYNNPAQFLETLNTLPHVSLRYVWNMRSNLKADITLLSKIFNCHIEVTPDHHKLSQLTVEHVKQLEEVIRYSKNNLSTTFDVLHSLSHCCDCRASRRRFFTDGFIGWEGDVPTEIINGCAMFHAKMDKSVYEEYKKLSEEVKK